MTTKRPVLFKLKSTLGPLEEQTMEFVWKLGTTRVREVYQALNRKSPLAYTTVMTVLGNLYRKGFVARTKKGKSYYYRPTSGEKPAVNASIISAISTLVPKRSIAYGSGLALAGIVSTYALFILYEDIHYSGVVEFFQLFRSDSALAGYALWESLPLASIAVSIFLIVLIASLVHHIRTFRAKRISV